MNESIAVEKRRLADLVCEHRADGRLRDLVVLWLIDYDAYADLVGQEQDEEIARLRAMLQAHSDEAFGPAQTACNSFIRLQHAGQWQCDNCAQCGRPEAEHAALSGGAHE